LRCAGGDSRETMTPDGYKDVEIARLQEQVVALKDVIQRDIVEVRRRLDELNHEHARNIERNREYLAAPLFFQYRDGVEVRLGAIDKAIANQAGRAAAYVTAVGLVFSGIFIVLHFVH
jgi:hypothetical protein